MFKFVLLAAACLAVASAGHLTAESAILSADPLTYSAIGGAHIGLASAPIIRSAPLAISSPTIIRSAPLAISSPAILRSAPLSYIGSPALSIHSAPALSHSSVNIVRSPLALNAGW